MSLTPRLHRVSAILGRRGRGGARKGACLPRSGQARLDRATYFSLFASSTRGLHDRSAVTSRVEKSWLRLLFSWQDSPCRVVDQMPLCECQRRSRPAAFSKVASSLQKQKRMKCLPSAGSAKKHEPGTVATPASRSSI